MNNYIRPLFIVVFDSGGDITNGGGVASDTYSFGSDADYKVLEMRCLGNTGITANLQLQGKSQVFNSSPFYTSMFNTFPANFRNDSIYIPANTTMIADWVNNDTSDHPAQLILVCEKCAVGTAAIKNNTPI